MSRRVVLLTVLLATGGALVAVLTRSGTQRAFHAPVGSVESSNAEEVELFRPVEFFGPGEATPSHRVEGPSPVESSTAALTMLIDGQSFAVEWDGPIRVLRYPSGEIYSRSTFLDGVRQGVNQVWYKSGMLSNIGEWVDGKRQGLWRSYHEDGTLLSEGHYDKGYRSGQWQAWRANGQLKSLGVYEVSLRVGKWSYWHPDGTVDTSSTGWYEDNLKSSD